MVRVPDAVDEAVRDLVRAREDAVREQRNGRHRLKALLLRNGTPYAGKSSWTAAHLRWLAAIKLPHTAQQIAFQEYLHMITEATARIARLEQALRDALPTWHLRVVVQALQALRGVQLIAAMTLVARVAGLHALRQSAPAHGLRGPGAGRAQLGPQAPPGQHHQGRQQCGAAHAGGGGLALPRGPAREPHHRQTPRRAAQRGDRHRVEGRARTQGVQWTACAWRGAKPLAWRGLQGQTRLNAKFKRLQARKVMKTKAVVAVARELAGFVWAIGREVQSSGWRGTAHSTPDTPVAH